MPAAFKGRVEPDAHDIKRHFRGDSPLAQCEDISVVVLACPVSSIRTPAKRAAHPAYFIGYNRFAVSRAAKHYASFAFTACHGFRGGSHKSRVINGLSAVSAEIADFMAQAFKERFNSFLVNEACVIASKGDFHKG